MAGSRPTWRRPSMLRSPAIALPLWRRRPPTGCRRQSRPGVLAARPAEPRGAGLWVVDRGFPWADRARQPGGPGPGCWGLLLGSHRSYTFSIILACVSCAGLRVSAGGIGSFLVRTGTRAAPGASGVCQLLLVGAVAWAAPPISTARLALSGRSARALASSPWYLFQLDLGAWSYGAILPPTCLLGARAFPLALAAAASARRGDAGRNGGARLLCRQHNDRRHHRGAGNFSTMLVPGIGTYQSQRLLIGVCPAGPGWVMFGGAPCGAPHSGRCPRPRRKSAPLSGAVLGHGRATVGHSRACLPAWWPSARGAARSGNPLPRLLFVGEGDQLPSVERWAELDGGRAQAFTSNGAAGGPRGRACTTCGVAAHCLGSLFPACCIEKPALGAGSWASVPGVGRAGSFRASIRASSTSSSASSSRSFRRSSPASFGHGRTTDVLKDPARRGVVYDDARPLPCSPRGKRFRQSSPPIPSIPGSRAPPRSTTQRIFSTRCAGISIPGGVATQWVPFYESTPEVVKERASPPSSGVFSGRPHLSPNEGEG